MIRNVCGILVAIIYARDYVWSNYSTSWPQQLLTVCVPGKLNGPHYTGIFSSESLQVGLPGRLSSMLGVPVVQNDSCPQRICRACIRKFTSVEANIKQLQQTAQTSYQKFTNRPSSRKRTKDTSGTVGVSPHTQCARPSAKQIAPSRLFLQSDSMYTQNCKE